MDLLQGVQDAVGGQEPPSETDAPKFELPSIEKILEALEKMNMSEESKEELRESLLSKKNLDNLGKYLPNMAKESATNAMKQTSSYDFLYLFILISLVALIFVFFGYKLYKSHADRERRKEEKRRQRQQKKKK